MTPSDAVARTIDPETSMDHGWYRYSPIVDRPRLLWPNGARVAVWILVVAEILDLERPDVPGQHPPAGGPLDVRAWSHRDYGNRCGIWRVMHVLDKHGIRGTLAVNSLVIERYPAIVSEALARGWEIAACGETGSRLITSKLPVEAERAMIGRSRDAIAASSGEPPSGWLSPQVSESRSTPGLLAEAGFAYCADWANDDQPFDLLVPETALTAVPYARDLDDQVVIFEETHPVWEWETAARDHFDTLFVEGEHSGRTMCIPLHPYCIGQPMRIRYLDTLLGHIAGHEDVWFALGREIAQHFRTLQS